MPSSSSGEGMLDWGRHSLFGVRLADNLRAREQLAEALGEPRTEMTNPYEFEADGFVRVRLTLTADVYGAVGVTIWWLLLEDGPYLRDAFLDVPDALAIGGLLLVEKSVPIPADVGREELVGLLQAADVEHHRMPGTEQLPEDVVAVFDEFVYRFYFEDGKLSQVVLRWRGLP